MNTSLLDDLSITNLDEEFKVYQFDGKVDIKPLRDILALARDGDPWYTDAVKRVEQPVKPDPMKELSAFSDEQNAIQYLTDRGRRVYSPVSCDSPETCAEEQAAITMLSALGYRVFSPLPECASGKGACAIVRSEAREALLRGLNRSLGKLPPAERTYLMLRANAQMCQPPLPELDVLGYVTWDGSDA